MLFQRVLVLWDKLISKIFWLQAWSMGDEKGKNRWIYFINVGRKIGVIGTDGKIHTMVSYWSVYHYYDGRRLLKRIPVRKDIKDGERLATTAEIARYQTELRGQFSMGSGGLLIS